MNFEAALRTGTPTAALPDAIEAVRRAPANGDARLTLAQIFTLLGEWERARAQWEFVAEFAPPLIPLAAACSALVRAESIRAEVWAGRRLPSLLGQPEPWMGGLLQALSMTARGEMEAAGRLRRASLEAAPAVAGSLNGQAFTWIADADSIIGPMLEIVVEGRYLWAPFTRIRSLEMDPPTRVRDLIWTDVRFTWITGGSSVGYVPVRYEGTERAGEDALLLARRTEWQNLGADTWRGRGQRMLCTDQGEHGWLDVRRLVLEPAEAEVARG